MKRTFKFQAPVFQVVTPETIAFAKNMLSPEKLRKCTGKCEKGVAHVDYCSLLRKRKIEEERFHQQLEEIGLWQPHEFLVEMNDFSNYKETRTQTPVWSSESENHTMTMTEIIAEETDDFAGVDENEEVDEIREMFSCLASYLQETDSQHSIDEQIDFGPQAKYFNRYMYCGEDSIIGNPCIRRTKNPEFLPKEDRFPEEK